MTVETIIRVSGLPRNATEAHLREVFEARGVAVARISMPEATLWQSCPTGRAEVFPASENDAVEAVACMDGFRLGGHRLTVSVVKIDDSLPPVTATTSGSDAPKVRSGATPSAQEPCAAPANRKRQRSPSPAADEVGEVQHHAADEATNATPKERSVSPPLP